MPPTKLAPLYRWRRRFDLDQARLRELGTHRFTVKWFYQIFVGARIHRLGDARHVVFYDAVDDHGFAAVHFTAKLAQELRAKVITAAVLAQVMAEAEAEAVLVAQVLQHLLVYIMGRMVAQEQLHHTLVHQSHMQAVAAALHGTEAPQETVVQELTVLVVDMVVHLER